MQAVAADFRSRSRSNLMDAERPTRPGPEDPAAVDTWSWLLDCRQTGFFQRKLAFKAIAIEEDNLHGVQLSSVLFDCSSFCVKSSHSQL